MRKLLESFASYRAYSRLNQFKGWLENREFFEYLFGDCLDPADIGVYIYQDEAGFPALEIQSGSVQLLVLRHGLRGEVTMIWTHLLVSHTEDSREFVVNATLEALDEINMALQFGSAYLAVESNAYALRFVVRLNARAFQSMQQFAAALGVIKEECRRNLTQRYQQFINQAVADQERIKEEFDIE